MGAAAGLQVDRLRALPDPHQPDPAGAARRAHGEGLDQVGARVQIGLRDPLVADRQVAVDQMR